MILNNDCFPLFEQEIAFESSRSHLQIFIGELDKVEFIVKFSREEMGEKFLNKITKNFSKNSYFMALRSQVDLCKK